MTCEALIAQSVVDQRAHGVGRFGGLGHCESRTVGQQRAYVGCCVSYGCRAGEAEAVGAQVEIGVSKDVCAVIGTGAYLADCGGKSRAVVGCESNAALSCRSGRFLL